MCGIKFLFQFSFGSVFEKKTRIRFRMSLVQFGSKKCGSVRFGYYSYLLLTKYYTYSDFDVTHNNDNK